MLYFKKDNMWRPLIVLVALCCLKISISEAVCGDPTRNGYECDCQFQYLCSAGVATHQGNDITNFVSSKLMGLVGPELHHDYLVYLTGNRQTRDNNQRTFCWQKCEGRARAALGAYATVENDNNVGYAYLATVLDVETNGVAAEQCCAVFIASKRGWCTGRSEWTVDKFASDFTYWKYDVVDDNSVTRTLYATAACGDANPFPDGLEVIP